MVIISCRGGQSMRTGTAGPDVGPCAPDTVRAIATPSMNQDRPLWRAASLRAAGTVSSMETDRRPVVALDLDGVLNPTVRRSGLVAHRVTLVDEDLPATPFVRRSPLGDDLEVTVHVSERLSGWVDALREYADVVWASTWEHLADEVYAPLLGIADLGHLSHLDVAPEPGEDASQWKARALHQRFAGRPICWVDDHAAAFRDRRWHDADTLVVVPDARIGIVAEDRSRIEAFVARHTCSCGVLRAGSTDTGARNWNPDCAEHGTASTWYIDPATVAARAEQSARAVRAQRLARLARTHGVHHNHTGDVTDVVAAGSCELCDLYHSVTA
jgi:hypothetical protein